ncbi:Bug family tripartite tricarboxylate transporter substrate binding protein [Pararoseomonas indoligenes]|uniref:Tripartite tricarboxylate transporter substrate binding protein n=1 Tax=Roseomonas indoligenes TaxID=2820811 RepID=A0A940N389_9PROT|nr:tripartite tricarboxylate transporter substrate-binding protein [Pararoseomonas indoligenes]MBP0495211.1 tripartite tricarboxylate transporter substrate binding protein [Pararoseomonas indoligenes]
MRRAFASLILSATALAALATPAAAQLEPGRVVRVQVGYTGGSFDAIGRIVAEGLRERLGLNAIVENKPGAGGSIASDYVAKATNDGTVILIGGAGTHGVTPALRRNLPFDAARDFTAIARVGEFPNAMTVSAALPVRTVQQFIALARRPGGVNFGSSGTGTSIHLTGELFRLRTGLEMTHVPYRGSGPAVLDLQADRIQVIFDNLPNVFGGIQGGTLRALAVTSRERLPNLPDVPTMAEAGMPDFVVSSWVGVFGPAGMNPRTVEQLSAAIMDTVRTEPGRTRVANLGAQPSPAGAAEFDAMWRADMRRWAEVVQAAKVEVDD